MDIKSQIIITIFLIVALSPAYNVTHLETEGELQKPVDRHSYDIPFLAVPDAETYIEKSMASTDLAVSKAEVQQKRIVTTMRYSSDIISSFVGEVAISRFRGVTDYRILTEDEKYAPNDYIADARVTLVDADSQRPLASFEGTAICIRQERETIYHIITDYGANYQQDYRIEVELGKRRPLTLPKDEVNILSPPASNRQVAPSENSLVYFRQPDIAQPVDTGLIIVYFDGQG